MNISELIEKLEMARNKYGDLPVYNDATEYSHHPIDFPLDGEIEVREEIKATNTWGEHVLPEPRRVVIS